MGTGLRKSPDFDIDYHQPTYKLVAGTHGRSLFEIDLNTITGINESGLTVNDYKLLQNYPNPFNPTTMIKYSVPSDEFVKLNVYNSIGEIVSTLGNEEKPAGIYELVFDASNLPSGIYFYRLLAGNYMETKNMVLMK